MEKKYIRPMQKNEISLMVDYFHSLSKEDCIRMGIKKELLPEKSKWTQLLQEDFSKLPVDKQFAYVVWCDSEKIIGHCNINKIIYGEEAYVHLHIWDIKNRVGGAGTHLFQLSIEYFAENFNLKYLFCEPKSDNIAPNKTLVKLGFKFLKQYETVPGWINSQQTVNRYELSLKKGYKK